MTAKRCNKVQRVKEGFDAFWRILALAMLKHGVTLLYGDWNMSLFIVKRQLAYHGVHVDLCAWMPMKQASVNGAPGSTKFDSCAMFLVGKTIVAPRVLWGLRPADHGGGDDGVEYLFEDYDSTHNAIPEGACEDDDSAGVPVGQAPLHDAGEEDLIIHPLITLPLKDGGILNSFMPGCGTKESIRERCRMNREALVEQLQYDETEYWREDFEAAWPGVKQKLLDRTIYDGSDVLLRSGSHVPLAIATIAPGQRSDEGKIERKKANARRKANAKKKWWVDWNKGWAATSRDGGSSDHAAVAAWQPSASAPSWRSSAASSAPKPQDAADGRQSFAIDLVSPATKETFWVSEHGTWWLPGRRSQSCAGTDSLSRRDRGGGRTWRSASASSSSQTWRAASSSSQTWRDQPWERRPHLFSEGSNSTAEKMLDQQERREWENREQR